MNRPGKTVRCTWRYWSFVAAVTWTANHTTSAWRLSTFITAFSSTPAVLTSNFYCCPKHCHFGEKHQHSKFYRCMQPLVSFSCSLGVAAMPDPWTGRLKWHGLTCELALRRPEVTGNLELLCDTVPHCRCPVALRRCRHWHTLGVACRIAQSFRGKREHAV